MAAYKTLLALLFCVFLVSPSSQANVKPNLSLKKPAGPTACKVCVEFMDNAIDQLLNIIANAGVLGSCAALCSELDNSGEDTICDLLCSYVGLTAFIDLIEELDPDPIYICEMLYACPVNTNAAGKIISAKWVPSSGPVGTTFNLQIVVNVTKQIGTGMLEFVVNPPGSDNQPFGDDVLLVDFSGLQGFQFQFQATPQEGEAFPPGEYETEVALCEGMCGSKHPYTETLSTATTSFKITG